MYVVEASPETRGELYVLVYEWNDPYESDSSCIQAATHVLRLNRFTADIICYIAPQSFHAAQVNASLKVPLRAPSRCQTPPASRRVLSPVFWAVLPVLDLDDVSPKDPPLTKQSFYLLSSPISTATLSLASPAHAAHCTKSPIRPISGLASPPIASLSIPRDLTAAGRIYMGLYIRTSISGYSSGGLILPG